METFGLLLHGLGLALSPMNLVYGVCMFGFACCALRSIQVAVLNWRRGYSVLQRPEIADVVQ